MIDRLLYAVIGIIAWECGRFLWRVNRLVLMTVTAVLIYFFYMVWLGTQGLIHT